MSPDDPTPKYWTSIEDREAWLVPVVGSDSASGNSAPPAVAETHAAPHHGADDGPEGDRDAISVSRRTFLVAAGFSAAGTLAACGRAPVQSVVPHLRQPEDVVPGKATWYASTCQSCPAGCGLLVKCRDGRPIKVEGNPDHPVSKGGVCAVGQASVLSLYDSRRLRRPRRANAESTWAEADRAIREGLAAARASGGAVRVVTGTVTSPTTASMCAEFLASFPDARRVAVDALPASAILDAHAKTHGARVLPRFRFERARAILGIEADFLGTWVSPVEFTRGRRDGRTLEGTPPRLSFHAQVEPALTLTGSNADRRLRVAPHETPLLVAHLVARLSEKAGLAGVPRPQAACPVPEKDLADILDRLWAARPHSMVVCGRNDVATQVLVNAANHALAAYGETVDVATPSRQREGDDAAFQALLDEMEAGKVAAIVVAGANPVVEAPGGRRFLDALSKVPLRVGLAERADETTAALEWVLPAPHALETWDDSESVAGVLSTTQPAISPFGEPRTLRECLAAWAGKSAPDLDLLRAAWRRDQFPRQSVEADPERFWRRTVHDGFAVVAARASGARGFDAAPVGAALAEATAATTPAAGRFSAFLHPVVSMLDGRHAQNPWLQELPDPIAKTTWGAAAALSPAAARALGIEDGDVVRISAAGGARGGAAGGASVELPAIVQPGTHDRAILVPLGYGRAGTDRFFDAGPRWLEGRRTVDRGGTVGADASPLLAFAGGAAVHAGVEVNVVRTGRREPLARSQTYDRLDLPARTAPKGHERRDMVRDATLSAYAADPAAGNPPAHPAVDLWPPDHEGAGPRWGMAIDLSACTGCSACVVACQAENNVPVVGRDEVLRRRDMAWMRIDRYYADVPGSPGDVDTAHQPMLCQHCGNAPCETVCPVLATVHSSEGLNSQVYNRCIGTRYCANNCPYKVRRFNWFDYRAADDPLADLVLNPDVTVRSRGVMEKCSFCVQRLHEAKAEAKREGRERRDGDVRTACQQSCPASAIVFGDLQDPQSAVSRLAKDPRHYRVLEEINVKPSVGYLTKVRHREGGLARRVGPRHG